MNGHGVSRRRAWACNTSAALIVGVVGWLFWQVTDRNPPFKRHHGEIVPANPLPGQEVDVVWDAEFVRDCSGIIIRTIMDAKGDIWTPPASVARYADRKIPRQTLSTFKLSPNIACGPAIYKADARYICNWTQYWWPIHVDQPVVKFNVACSE